MIDSMKIVFWISKENIPLAVEEILSLTNTKEHILVGDLVIIDCKEFDFSRLALTRAVYKFLFCCHKKDLIKKIKIFDWQKFYKKNFKLEVHHTQDFVEKELAIHIYNSIKNPKVKMENPFTKFDLFFEKDQVIAGKLLFENKEDFAERRAHLRPEHHPSSMHPKLARALINLTGIKNGKLYDPFCGSGGILIEAGLTGLTPVGYDIDEEMLRKARKNLEFYKIKKFQTKKQNATKIKHKIDFLATDVPYGRGTKKVGEDLYFKFLRNLKKVLQVRAVIMFPHFVDYKKLIKKAKLKIKKEFLIYVHHDLTRKIAVVENDNLVKQFVESLNDAKVGRIRRVA